MKGSMMKTFALCLFLMVPGGVCMAETVPTTPQTQGPELYDHFMGMQQTQERLSQRSQEEQERLHPRVRQAERQACQRLRQDRQNGVREDDYRRQGGEEFVAYALQFERYCETLR